jgi:hypothetical protein
MKPNQLEATLMAAFLAVIALMYSRDAFCAQQPAESPVELVRRTVQHEIAASNGDAKIMFTDRKVTPHGSQTKLIVETSEGMAGMVVANNDAQLSREQRLAEVGRLARLVNSPDELKKKQRTEKEDAERVTRIMKALPDAFLYETDGTVAGNHEVGGTDKELVRLRFRPNPTYSPPSRVEQVLTGMQGFVLIDPEQHRIAKIDGTLGREVNFGWGFLGHLDKGGHFLVAQAEVVKEDWEITRMDLGFTGKVLLFKSLNIKSDETFSDFQRAPAALSFAQGVEMLKQKELEFTENGRLPAGDKPK